MKFKEPLSLEIANVVLLVLCVCVCCVYGVCMLFACILPFYCTFYVCMHSATTIRADFGNVVWVAHIDLYTCVTLPAFYRLCKCALAIFRVYFFLFLL